MHSRITFRHVRSFRHTIDTRCEINFQTNSKQEFFLFEMMNQCMDRWMTSKCQHISIVHISAKGSERFNFRQGTDAVWPDEGDEVIFDHIYVKNLFQFMQQKFI